MIQDQTTKVIYVGNGQTTHFPFKFKYNDKTHIHVAIYDIDTQVQTELTKDFFVDSEKNEVIYPGYQSGQEPPEAQIPPVLQANQKLVIYRQTPLTQEIDFGSKYPLPFVENGTDKNTMISQEMKEALERSVKVDMGSEVKPDELLTDIKQNVADANQSAQNAQQSADEAQEYAQNANANAQSINIRTFPNVETMKQANNLKAGGLIKTQGFYQPNDGGGADYVIVDSISEDEVDEASILTLQKGLFAKLLINDFTTITQMGAINNGSSDVTNIINISIAKKSNAIIDNGTYKINGDINTGVLVFTNNGKITGNANLNYVEIQAPLTQIFIDMELAGTVKNNEVYPQWWGGYPIDGKTTDNLAALHTKATDSSNAVQKAIDFANNKDGYGAPNIKLSNGYWRLDNTLLLEDNPNYENTQLLGNGMNKTILDFSGNSTDNLGIIIKNTTNGTGGNSRKNVHGSFFMYGSTNTTLITFKGCVGHTFRNVRFNQCEWAVHFFNDETKMFTEQCKLDNCWFDWFCHKGIKYSRNAGDGSFRGCGLRNCFAEHYCSRGPFIQIGTNCSPYNAELDLHISLYEGFSGGHPMIYLAPNVWCPNFYGHITVEADEENSYLCYGYEQDNTVALNFMGTIASWGHGVNLGNLVQCRNYLSNPDYTYPSVADYEPRHYRLTLDVQQKFGFCECANGCLYTIDLSKDGYSYKGMFVIFAEYNAGDLLASTLVPLVDKVVWPQSGGTKPTITQATHGQLVITPPSGITDAKLNLTITPLGFDRRYAFIGATRANDINNYNQRE